MNNKFNIKHTPEDWQNNNPRAVFTLPLTKEQEELVQKQNEELLAKEKEENNRAAAKENKRLFAKKDLAEKFNKFHKPSFKSLKDEVKDHKKLYSASLLLASPVIGFLGTFAAREIYKHATNQDKQIAR